ncbi:transposase [Cohnella fermenti]|uniref:transposase n=1 Tax=Cohnella fermenti TaxID=2565925 RepID=UPI001B3B2D7B|nr:transposase [Cohnella fermenti]
MYYKEDQSDGSDLLGVGTDNASAVANRTSADGWIFGPTRDEVDFARHVEHLIETDPEAEWVFIADGLNTYQSESLVRIVARHCD